VLLRFGISLDLAIWLGSLAGWLAGWLNFNSQAG
jgi:hypothetical protein